MTTVGDARRSVRRLAAILAADLVGFSRLMGRDEAGTLARLRSLRTEIIEPLVAKHQGRVFKTTGDGFLVEFPSPVEAVEAAAAIQQALRDETARDDSQPLQLRIGINLGDLVIEPDGDVFGDGVNVAARLEQMADPGTVVVSDKVYDEVRGKVPFHFEDRGEQQVKNIERLVRVFQLGDSRISLTSVRSVIAQPVPNKPSIAVLPFTNVSGDPEQEVFADGIVEDIMTALSRLRWLFVIGRNSTFTYKGKVRDVKQVGRELGVRYVLEGSTRTAGLRLRVTAQLVDAENGAQVWAERYDRNLPDLFDVQDEITSSVVGAIEPQLVAAEARRLERRQPSDLRAWEWTVRALPHIWRLTAADTEKAQEFLRRAIDLDSQYAYAHALMAWSYMQMWGIVGVDRRPELLHFSEHYVRIAALLDEQEPWVYVTSGLIYSRRREPDQAIAALQMAINLNPNFALAHAYLGYALTMAGQPRDGLDSLARATRLSPRDPFLASESATIQVMCHFVAGNYDEVIRLTRGFVLERPDFLGAYRLLAAACALLGRYDEAKAALREALRLHPTFRIADVERANSFSDADARLRYLDGLRKAGLPE